MRFAMLVLLIVAAPLWAQTPAPNTISPEYAHQGFILLFDGESMVGWDAKGDVAVRDGHIVLGKGAGDSLAWRGQPPALFHLTAEVRGSVQFLQKDQKGQVIAATWDGGEKWTKKMNTIVNKDNALVKNFVAIEFKGLDDRAAIRSIKLQPVETKVLFFGNADLAVSGWKVFEGKKSKFDVKDGLLTIENGPGDLQTVAKYKNFLLQLECKTNGKHLNSGVFFRCRAGEYQNGYEAQINNNFTASPPKDYVVEEFDPKTNKLLDKKKVKSTAADFGTGSIYRRIPATKDIAKDGEWFTMTILAHGNHFATWVNGIQTVDWYDNRPPNDNARNGYRSEGGHISLQGHDPTTNLSFRNIRIAELPD